MRRIERVSREFSRHTINALKYLFKRNIVNQLLGVIAVGKESRIYLALSPRGEKLVLKIYQIENPSFKQHMRYILGDYRFRRIGKTRWRIATLWCSKEYRNMIRAHNAGIPVPKPIIFKENILVMEFIGENFTPAPSLREKTPENLYETYINIINYIDKLYHEAELVHGDLSEYNILNHHGKIYLIDWSSAVNIYAPNARELLFRDIKNISIFFSKHGVNVEPVESVFNRIIGF